MKAFMTCKLLSFKLLIISFSLLLSFFNSYSQEADRVIGKKLFNSYCASCHKVNKRAVGPALRGVSEKYDREWLYSWIKNSSAMIKSGDAQAISIWEEYNKSVMTAFPQLSNVDIDNIIAYTDYIPPVQTQVNTSKNITASKEESTFSNTLILS